VKQAVWVLRSLIGAVADAVRALDRKTRAMDRARWTYEVATGWAASEGLEDYEARTADGRHLGVVIGAVRLAGEVLLLVDAGAMPPLIHRRIAVRWEDIAEVDHAALVVQLSVDRARLDDTALALDPKLAMHGPGAEAVRVTRLPAALTRPHAPGVGGPVERGSAIAVLVLAAAAPFSLFVIVALWIARGLAGWEYGLLAIPYVLASLTVALEGYRLFREPHAGHRAASARAGEARLVAPPVATPRSRGRSGLVLFALGGGVLYLTAVLSITLALGEELPVLGWVGFAVAAAVVLAAGTAFAIFLVRSSAGAGSEAPLRRAVRQPGVRRVLVIADEGCSGEALCRPIAGKLLGQEAEVLVVAPALVSAVHYLDSDVDAARAVARARLAETVESLTSAGITARGKVGSESPLEAIADALAIFAADEIVVATPPSERTNWLEQGVVARASELYEVPVSHLVVETPRLAGPRPR
jgi:hypothetical protein